MSERKIIFVSALVFGLLAFINCSLAEILNVPADYLTIQAGIDNSNDGDIVLVAPGTYTGDGNRDVDFKGKAITVKSKDGYETCIINCEGSENEPHRGFLFHSGEDTNSVLQGFTITNGCEIEGGGIFCHTAGPLITDCLITDNTALVGMQGDGGGGGGIKCLYSNLTVVRCMIYNNSAEYGGGVSSGGHFGTMATLTMINCSINGNKAKGSGGGIYCNGETTFLNCNIFGNHTGAFGGGIYMSYTLRINNSIIYGNMTPKATGSEIARTLPGAAGCNPESIKITYSIVGIDSNSIDFPRCYSGQWLQVDPLFAQPGYWININDPNIIVEPDDPNAIWVDGDYHLKSQAGRWDPVSESWVVDYVTSPCIDAGDPNNPVGDEPEPNGGRINMGAYGGTAEASKSFREE